MRHLRFTFIMTKTGPDITCRVSSLAEYKIKNNLTKTVYLCTVFVVLLLFHDFKVQL